jgi:hypothetical protein
MKNIIISESKFIKLFDNLIKEVVGVPENILETTKKVYDLILDELDNFTEKNEEYNFQINSEFKISDITFEQVNVFIKVETNEMIPKPMIISMATGLNSRFDSDDFKLKYHFDNSVDLKIQVALEEDWELNDLKDFFIEEKNEFLSSFAHELKHNFDFRKKKVENPKTQVDYISSAEVSVGIPPIDKFIFSLYFTHSIENLVRPVELASLLSSNNVTKKGFYDFFTKTRLYEVLKSLQKDSYENFRSEIEMYLPDLREYLENNKGLKNLDEKTDDQVIDIVLFLTYELLSNTKISQMHQMIMDSPLEMILGFIGEKQEFFNKFIKDVRRYKDPNEFFRSQFDFFKIISTKMIKKLAKLYSISADDVSVKKETTESKSIHNWDLYHKYKKTKRLFPIKTKTTK